MTRRVREELAARRVDMMKVGRMRGRQLGLGALSQTVLEISAKVGVGAGAGAGAVVSVGEGVGAGVGLAVFCADGATWRRVRM